MRVAIVGAGALGCTFGALLDRAGHEVQLVARGAQLDAIRADGLHLQGGFGDWLATRLRPVEAIDGQPDLAMVCVKAHDADAAISANADALQGIPVMIVQNGLGGVERASALLPASSCFGALSIVAASYLAPGRVTVTTAATTYIGRGPGPVDAGVRAVERALGDDLRLSAIGNFAGAQWTKLVVNQINALPAITGMSAQDVIAEPRLRMLMTRSMQEAVQTGVASGIRFGALQGLSNARLRLFAHLPVSAGQLLPLLFSARMGAVPNPGSTLQSLRRGQRTEIDHLNGAIVRAARAAGRTAPVNALLTELVHEVERTGSFLSADAVVHRADALDRG